MKINLNVQNRHIADKKTNDIRKEWNVPWVIYWKHLEAPIHVIFNKNEFIKLYREAWESTPVNLIWDKIKELVLIHELQRHFVTDTVLHVDFHAIRADEKVKAEVPVWLIWESIIEKNKEWRVELLKDHILVEALPGDLPHDIKIDISRIKELNDVIFIRDLDLWSKVEIKDNKDLPVVTVVTLQEEVEEAPKATEEAAPTATANAKAPATPKAWADKK